MGIVDGMAGQIHIRAQPSGKLRREADLHGTAVRLLAVERLDYAIARFHGYVLWNFEH